MKNKLIIFYICVLSFSCKKENSPGNYFQDSNVFQDQYGRTLIFHGVSLYTNDDPGDGYTRYNSNSAKRLINEWGFNSVRMFWSWNALQPDSAVFAPAKLDSIVKVVETFTNEGIYVVMAVNGTATWNQDRLSGTWQKPSGNAQDIPSLTYSLNPKAQEATRRFWDYKNFAYLQDEFIKASIYVAGKLKNNPYVLGYDIMNEPWGDGLISTILNTNLESQLLPVLYQKYITEMRKTEPDKYIFFEPSVLFNIKEVANFQTKLPAISDARNGVKRLSFAPHCYLANESINSIQNNYNAYLNLLKNNYTAIQQKQQVPIYIGEWANINYATFPDAENCLNKHMAVFDELKASWSYFGYFPSNPDDISENPALNVTSRVYPTATSGELKSFSYNPDIKEFKMTFINNASIAQPTEIFIPKRHYPNGFNTIITGTENYSQVFDDIKNLLSIRILDKNKTITIDISSK